MGREEASLSATCYHEGVDSSLDVDWATGVPRAGPGGSEEAVPGVLGSIVETLHVRIVPLLTDNMGVAASITSGPHINVPLKTFRHTKDFWPVFDWSI